MPSKKFHRARHQDQMVYPQRSLNVAVPSFTMYSISCCANGGRREQSPKRCEILLSQRCTRTMVTAVTVTIIAVCLAGKLFARVALRRLQQLAERVYP